MTTGGTDGARQRLKADIYRPLWVEARGRLERTGLAITNRPVPVDVSGEARIAIAGLLGQSPAGSKPLSVRLDRLDEVLRGGRAAIGLVEMIELVDGRLVDRRAARAERVEAVTSLWRSLEEHPAIEFHPRLAEWLDTVRSRGLALRLAGSIDEVGPLVGRGLDVLARLPVEALPLAVLAAEVTGDAHALDRSTPLGSLVANALGFVDSASGARESGSVVIDTGPEIGHDADRVDEGEVLGATATWRGAWSRVGVVCDDLSVSVLVLNLELATPVSGPVSAAITEHRRAGLPLRLTLQQVRSEPLRLVGKLVRSCENPSVLAHAAATLGAESGPLLCTDGQPNSAVDHLIGGLRAAGTTVAHHGDFDWGGIRIANSLIARHQVEPWRMSTTDYLDGADLGRVPLDDPRYPLSACWDPELVPAMSARGVCVFEEQLLPTLIADLHRGPAARTV